jgi:hypothetical protein
MPKQPFDDREPSPLEAFDPRDLPDPDFSVPDFVVPEVGWRTWATPIKLPRYGVPPKLYSASQDYYWVPRQEGVATCTRCKADVPGEGCYCGFYAARNLEHLTQLGYERHGQFPSLAKLGFKPHEVIRIVGECSLWGKVIPASQGWRASKAYPKTLYVEWEHRHLAEPLADSYGVPVLLRLMTRVDEVLKGSGI